MSDELNPAEANEPNVDPNQAIATPPPQANDSIQISKQEYAQLMTQLAVMQNQLETATAPKAEPVPYAGKNINQLTNEEMFDLFQRQSNEQQQQVVNALMQIAVKEEIRDLGDTYPEFKSDKATRDAVFAIAEKNTQLSLEQAFLIHKGKAPAPKPQPTPVVTPTPPPGERPGVQAQTVVAIKPMSVREAAEAALKTLKYDN